jgi:hypothetical protein
MVLKLCPVKSLLANIEEEQKGLHFRLQILELEEKDGKGCTFKKEQKRVYILEVEELSSHFKSRRTEFTF